MQELTERSVNACASECIHWQPRNESSRRATTKFILLALDSLTLAERGKQLSARSRINKASVS